MRLLLPILAIVLTIQYAYASDQPAPSTRTGSTEKQHQTTESDAASNDAIYQTANPSGVVINVAPLQTNAAQTYPERNNEKDDSSYSRLTALATAALAIITFFLAIFTYGLWSGASETSKRQAKEMIDSNGAAVRAAKAMEEVAQATKANADRMESVFAKQMRACRCRVRDLSNRHAAL